MRILVVDDNEFILEVVSRMLADEDFDISRRTSVDSAIECIESEKGFDLVITDIVMPEKDGTKLAQYVKSTTPNVPVLAITGGIENALQDYINLAEMFADETLSKPLEKETLLKTIRKLAA